MVFLGYCVMRLAAVAHWIGGVFERVGLLFTDMLPALLSPIALTQLVRSHYDRSYDDAHAKSHSRPSGALTSRHRHLAEPRLELPSSNRPVADGIPTPQLRRHTVVPDQSGQLRDWSVPSGIGPASPA